MTDYPPDDIEQAESTVTASSHFTIVPNGVLRADLSSRARDTYILMRSYLREGHATFPKIETVAASFNRSESFLKRGIKELADKGFLIITKRSYRGGFLRVNQYHFPEIDDDGTPRPARPSGGGKSDPSGSVRAETRPDVSDLTPTKEEEKYEEEKYLSPPGGPGAAPERDGGQRRPTDALPVVAVDPEILDAEIVDNDEPTTAHALVTKWVGHRQALTGARPTGRVIGQLGRELKALLDEGQPLDDVRAGLRLWDSKNLHPSTLASCVDEARGPVPKSRRQAEIDQIFTAALARADAGVPNPFMTADDYARAR